MMTMIENADHPQAQGCQNNPEIAFHRFPFKGAIHSKAFRPDVRANGCKAEFHRIPDIYVCLKLLVSLPYPLYP